MLYTMNGYEMNLPDLLVNGNAKIGSNVYHFSTAATNKGIGTCFCNCPGCYGTTGCYCFASTKYSLSMRTYFARNELEFTRNELIREIHENKIKYVRIHATGDFFSREYVQMWIDVAKECPKCVFWTYTKSFGHGFDDVLNELNSLVNVNIVKSVVPGCGFNFGECGYILDTYYKLQSDGKNPYICKCGIDDTVHCNKCHKCSEREYVLFIEHSTNYKAKDDALYNTVAEIVNNQQ